MFASAFDTCILKFHEGFEQPFWSCLSTDSLHGRQVVVQLIVENKIGISFFGQYCEKSETKFKNLGWSKSWITSFKVNSASVLIHGLNGYSESHPKCALDHCWITYSEQDYYYWNTILGKGRSWFGWSQVVICNLILLCILSRHSDHKYKYNIKIMASLSNQTLKLKLLS